MSSCAMLIQQPGLLVGYSDATCTRLGQGLKCEIGFWVLRFTFPLSVHLGLKVARIGQCILEANSGRIQRL
jgi:hypothetical protein